MSGADDSRGAVEKGIRQALFTDRGGIAMAGMHDGLRRQRGDALERFLEL